MTGIRKKGRRDNHVKETMSPARSFDVAVDVFTRHCASKNLTGNTIKTYKETLLELTRLLGDIDVQIPEDVTKTHITFVIDKKRTTRMNRKPGRFPSDQTINKLIRSWSAFFKFLAQEGHLRTNPMEKVNPIRSEKRIIETFSNDQLKAILGTPDRKTFTGFRDYALMSFLLDTGVRVKEAELLNLSDVIWSDRILRIYGKGRKERFVPFSRRLETVLKAYLELRGVLPIDAFFVNIDDKRYQDRGMQQSISNYGKIAGITDVRCSPHTFRHTFAKMYILNGGDAFSLQRILGHESMEMTRRYVNLFSRDLSRQHEKFSPLDNLR